MRTRARILAPSLLAYEVANALYRRALLGELRMEDVESGLARILDAFHKLDQDRATHVRAVKIAHEFDRPTPYDAHYLALAEREGCECWTADERLWNAVKHRLSYVRWVGEVVV
jgi:predicted nucleic acid-binding protein